MKNEKLYEQFKEENELNPLIRNYETDNKDPDETTLWLDTNDRVDIYPWSLVENIIENQIEDEDDCNDFLTELQKLKERIEEYIENIE